MPSWAFAALLGATLADASERLLSSIEQFGRDLGVALQMFDDLGNAIGKCEPSKRYEDLTLRELFTLAGRSLEDYVELLPVTPF